jgi:hypothetical protein
MLLDEEQWYHLMVSSLAATLPKGLRPLWRDGERELQKLFRPLLLEEELEWDLMVSWLEAKLHKSRPPLWLDEEKGVQKRFGPLLLEEDIGWDLTASWLEKALWCDPRVSELEAKLHKGHPELWLEPEGKLPKSLLPPWSQGEAPKHLY